MHISQSRLLAPILALQTYRISLDNQNKYPNKKIYLYLYNSIITVGIASCTYLEFSEKKTVNKSNLIIDNECYLIKSITNQCRIICII